MKNIILKIYFFIFKNIAHLKIPQFTALILFFSLLKLKKIRKISKYNKNKVIILDKSGGIDDLIVSFTNSNLKFKPYVLQRRCIFIIHKVFFKKILNDRSYFFLNKKNLNIKKNMRNIC